jgi:magnesium transporter
MARTRMKDAMKDTRIAAAAARQSETDAGEILLERVRAGGPRDAARLLEGQPDGVVVQVLEAVNPALAQDILDEFSVQRRQTIIAAVPVERHRQWLRNQAYPEGSVGRLMDPPVGIFSADLSVREAIDQLRKLVTRWFITYGYVTDSDGRLCGVLVMRDLLFADPTRRLDDIMVRAPFALRPEMELMDAMRLVVYRHYPAYPVCDADGRIVGVVRGQTLFEAEAFEISAQAGSMVGVDKEERLATPWPHSLRLRQPWLQLNLLTAFLAGLVVTAFHETINQFVVLAAFLPVLGGQAGNTGCQVLAVTLRGLTLGDLDSAGRQRLLAKEALLGLLNGVLVGVSAAVAMYAVASAQGHGPPLPLGLIVFAAMTGSCVISGLTGALVPLVLKRFAADPATASCILVTTVTDVISMGFLLGLARWFLG